VRVQLSGTNYLSLAEVQILGVTPPNNVALNKTATQSSTPAWGNPASKAVDGNTDGVWANGSVTHTDSNLNAWWQVDLGQVETIGTIKIWNRVEAPERLTSFYVFVSDQPFTSTDLTTTQNQSGVSSYYTSAQCGFPTELAIYRTGRYIRVQLSGTNYLSIAEVQIFTGPSTPPVQWLISDHLGTPRMVLDQTGNLNSMRRHDYLPFGEELTAPTSGRTTAQGYAGGDGIRQQFTLQERDLETGLDYFVARYYANTQGRFTSADQPFADQSANNPQSWNLYSYVRNNPLVIVDPSGRFGDYYNRNGSWAYSDGINDDRVYVLNETGEADGSVNLTPQLLPITHTEFTRSANIVRHEGTSNDVDEYFWIAYASNNEAIATNTTLYNLLQTGFSSAPASVKNSRVATTDISFQANAARAGVLDALAGGADPTGGARRWDGTDFLAWGLNGPWGSHAKFREFASIHISGQIFSTYENAQIAKWGNSVTYSRTSYTIPAAVFTNAANWTQNRDFHYVTGARNQTRNLVATGAKGHTIFWRF
jgi:RHS repeat-associated protein